MVSVWFCTNVKCKLTFPGLLNSSSQRFSINTVAFVEMWVLELHLTLRQLGNTDVPHLLGALRSCPHVPVSRSLPLVLISWTTSVITSDLRIIWLSWIEISLLTCTCCYLAVSSWGLEGRGHSRTEFTCTTQALLQINTVFSAYLLCSFGLALLQLYFVYFLAVTSAGLGVVLLYYRAQILLVELICSAHQVWTNHSAP